MTNKQIPTTAEGKFGKELQQLITTIVRQQRFVIPTFAADPPETDPTNLWMRYDGRLRGRYWNGASYTYIDYPLRSDITSPPAVPAYPAAPAATTPPTSHFKTYTAIWGQSYDGLGAYRTDALGNVYAFFGSETPWGDQKSLLGFEYWNIAADLSGSTINSVTLNLTGVNSYYDNGATVSVGMHNEINWLATYDVTTAPVRRAKEQTVLPGSDISIDLPVLFGQKLRDNSAKGILLEAPNSDKGMWGSVANTGGTLPFPTLTISYAK